MRTTVEENEVKPDEIDKIIYRAYNTVSNVPDLDRIKFTFEEVCDFLARCGYKIVKAKGMAKVVNSHSTIDMEVIKTDGGYQEVENVFAKKPDQIIPLDFGSNEARVMEISRVFCKLMKHKLLY